MTAKNSKKVIVALEILLAVIAVFSVIPIHYVSADPKDRTIEVEYESTPEKDSYSRPSEWIDENLKIVDAETLEVKVTELHKMSILEGDGGFDFDSGMKVYWVVEDTEGYFCELIWLGREKPTGFPAGRDIRNNVLREDWYPSYWSGTLAWNPENARIVDIPYGTPEVGPHEMIITPPPGEYIAWVGLREDSKLIRFKIVPKES